MVDALGALEAGHTIVGEDFSVAAVRGPLAPLVAHTDVVAVGGVLAIICPEDVIAGLALVVALRRRSTKL